MSPNRQYRVGVSFLFNSLRTISSAWAKKKKKKEKKMGLDRVRGGAEDQEDSLLL